jgi:charged multivesicular body protein 2A
MSFLFGGQPPTASELARKYKHHIDRSLREIDREIQRLNAEEKLLMTEIKKMAGNHMKMCMQKAQAIVRLRKTLDKFSNMKAHLQGISQRINSVKTTESLQRAVSSAVSMMQNFNKLSGGEQLVATIHEMEKQNAFINFQGEILDERLDAVFEEDNDEQDSCTIMESILLEAGVEIPSTYLSIINSESITSQLQRCNVPNT